MFWKSKQYQKGFRVISLSLTMEHSSIEQTPENSKLWVTAKKIYSIGLNAIKWTKNKINSKLNCVWRKAQRICSEWLFIPIHFYKRRPASEIEDLDWESNDLAKSNFRYVHTITIYSTFYPRYARWYLFRKFVPSNNKITLLIYLLHTTMAKQKKMR